MWEPFTRELSFKQKFEMNHVEKRDSFLEQPLGNSNKNNLLVSKNCTSHTSHSNNQIVEVIYNASYLWMKYNAWQ
jgi:hypothetical protein